MRFNFSLKTTMVCSVLALCMLRASWWQWERHLEKQDLIKTLQATLKREVAELLPLAQSAPNWDREIWRRVRVSGTYDFAHEVIVRRNRGTNDQAGFHVVTPLKIDADGNATPIYILVDRGFIPLGRQDREYRKRYQTPEHATLYGLVKASSAPKFLAPSDPELTLDTPWVDLWIRINIAALQKQLPYRVLPVYIEVMEDPDDPFLADKIVKEGQAGRNDVLALTGQKQVQNFGLESPDLAYPIAHFDTTPPPDIHLGYVYEWAFMALLTTGIGVIAQFKRSSVGAQRSDPTP
jgi:cytochrome oxidase assembly protein ShyY1